MNMEALAQQIKGWATELGFQAVGITNTDLTQAEQQFNQQLYQGYYGEMAFMHRHGHKRSRPALLVPETLRIISLAMNYLPEAQTTLQQRLMQPQTAYISRYALGRDYHKTVRQRTAQLAAKIQAATANFHYRVFVDSAPVLEKPLAQKAGLGWQGKHNSLINKQKGSWFFLAEIYTNLPLPPDRAATNHCGRCTACINVCPTHAIVAPYQVDARLCISYLTIEYSGTIPEALRPLLGNRIYGCDDCQLVCPWNRFAQLTQETDFLPRHGLDSAQLLSLFLWDEATFLRKTEGSAIRRIGHVRWLRNIAIALGNSVKTPEILHALQQRRNDSSELVQQHCAWALTRV